MLQGIVLIFFSTETRRTPTACKTEKWGASGYFVSMLVSTLKVRANRRVRIQKWGGVPPLPLK